MTEDKYISLKELKEHVKLEELAPSDLFTEEQLRADPELQRKIEKLIDAEIEKQKEEEDDMIPDVEPSDDKPKKKNGESNDEEDLIPD